MADNRGPELLIVNIVFFVVTACIVIMRCYTRICITKAFGADDWLMVIATAFFLGYIICSNLGVRFGTGQHKVDLAPENYETAKMLWWFCYLFFGITMCAAKLSFGWLLLRIVCKPAHAYIIYSTSAIVMIAAIIFFFVTVLQCNPVTKFWKEDEPGYCIPPRIFTDLAYLYSAVSVVTDLSYALLPAFVIWHVQLRTRIRFILIILMGLGCLASCAVIVRILYFRHFSDPDFLYATTDIAIWSTIEMGLGISAASFSTLRPLARSLGWSIGFSSSGSVPSGGNNHNNNNNTPLTVGQIDSRRPSRISRSQHRSNNRDRDIYTQRSQESQDRLHGSARRGSIRTLASQQTTAYTTSDPRSRTASHDKGEAEWVALSDLERQAVDDDNAPHGKITPNEYVL
ncbi:hypothetical protein VHEMI02818 [[Torrubiella] hemipterigena]|uniref:Rhodopsin domain-containing protein n=1 Tax=[Torrubiella] hemipterigena TaxID=1531966 RepID=A0A0A1T9C1_9HYPO|nr:hypothetical protein VHEMI02818 [[Torrubiella] hemipterigena]